MTEKQQVWVVLAVAIVGTFAAAYTISRMGGAPCRKDATDRASAGTITGMSTTTKKATGVASAVSAPAPKESVSSRSKDAPTDTDARRAATATPAPTTAVSPIQHEHPLDRPRKPVENQPMPAPMYDALARHFSQYEAARLVSLYALVQHREPQDWADVRTRAKEILGDEGFKILMTEAAPPAGVQPNTDEMVQYVLSRPALGWWFSLKE